MMFPVRNTPSLDPCGASSRAGARGAPAGYGASEGFGIGQPAGPAWGLCRRHCTGVTMGSPRFFNRTTTNLAGSVRLALREIV